MSDKKKDVRPYRFLVDGYVRIIKAVSQRDAMRQALRKWGSKATPQL